MYHINSCDETTKTITFSSDSSIMSDEDQENVRISFGINTVEVDIEFSDFLEEDDILLSTDVIEELQIPLSCFYDILINEDEDEIQLGPFIGILTELTDQKVEKMLFTYKSFVRGYQQIGGAILVFSLEGIHVENNTISGYMYHPNENSWVFGTFPFPATVMTILEASLTSKWKEFHDKINHFIQVIGKKVFNYPHFSKWEMYELLLPTFEHILPETTVYKEPKDIYQMLKLHDSIYIKPIYGRLGRQIFKVVQTNKSFVVSYYRKRKKHVRIFSTQQELLSFFLAYLVPHSYLIQQTLPLMVNDHRVIDFRVMMVKNERGRWENLGVYSRYGAKGQLVSNITAGGQTEVASDTLKTVWNMSEEEVEEIYKKIDELVKDILNLFEQEGYHLANIGFDIGIDQTGKIYIIEINHQNPDPYIALKANNRHAFYMARFKNMMYAKHLEGF